MDIIKTILEGFLNGITLGLYSNIKTRRTIARAKEQEHKDAIEHMRNRITELEWYIKKGITHSPSDLAKKLTPDSRTVGRKDSGLKPSDQTKVE